MIDQIQKLITTEQMHAHTNQGITIVVVPDASVGCNFASKIVTNLVDSRTVLYLSGGRTPQSLYHDLARAEHVSPGAVGLVDERYGPKFHKNSNEKMIVETELVKYLSLRDVPFYPILGKGATREETAHLYDEQLRANNALFQKSMAILGIGSDGHTAGIPAKKTVTISAEDEKLYTTYELAAAYHDTTGMYGERVTMTFLALSLLDLLVVLVFGEDKQHALKEMFSTGSEEDIPSRFYTRPEIAGKTVILTDQMI